MPAPVITAGMRVRSKEREWYCLCGHCCITSAETLTVAERKMFPGIGAMIRFEEHQRDDHEPWFLASGFVPRHDG